MITRRQAVAAAATGAVSVRSGAAFAAATDRGPLEALVAYEQQVVFGYEVALAKAPLTRSDRATLTRFRAEAAAAVTALRRALEQERGRPSPPPDPGTAPPPTDPSRRGYLRDLISAEEASIQGYYAALQSLQDQRHLAGAVAFMAQAGRRLVLLRKLAGQPLLPRAFETGGA